MFFCVSPTVSAAFMMNLFLGRTGLCSWDLITAPCAPAAAAQRALVAEQQRRAELEAELEVLRAQLARVGSSSCPASDDEGGSIRALRPPTSRQAGAAASGGLTPRSRLAQSATAAAAPPPAQSTGSGRLTPRSSGGAGSRGLTPRSALSAGASGSATPRSGSGATARRHAGSGGPSA